MFQHKRKEEYVFLSADDDGRPLSRYTQNREWFQFDTLLYKKLRVLYGIHPPSFFFFFFFFLNFSMFEKRTACVLNISICTAKHKETKTMKVKKMCIDSHPFSRLWTCRRYVGRYIIAFERRHDLVTLARINRLRESKNCVMPSSLTGCIYLSHILPSSYNS